MNAETKVINARLRRNFFTYLKEAKGWSERTIAIKERHVARYENYWGKDLGRCGTKKCFMQYKHHMQDEKTYTKKTVSNILYTIYTFYLWLSFEPGYRGKIKLRNLEYLNLPKGIVTAINTSSKIVNRPKMEYVISLVNSIAVANEIDRRDRALILFLLFSPARVGSISDLKIKHFDVDELTVDLLPLKKVRTKGGISNRGFLLVFELMLLPIIIDYVKFLNDEKCFGPDDPLFPSTLAENLSGDNSFSAVRLSKSHWKGTGSINKVLKARSKQAGLTYFNPHSFRSLHYLTARKCCRNEEERSAVAQNMGHARPTTSEIYYGNIDLDVRLEILKKIDFSAYRNPETEFQKLNSKMDELLKRMPVIETNKKEK